MNFEIIGTVPFSQRLKKLSKKYPSLKSDLSLLFERLSKEPEYGIPLGRNCFKIRLAIKSKSRGKSGGARIITYVKIVKHIIYLIDIYDKSEQASISDEELKLLIELLT